MREPPICLNITSESSNDLAITSPLGIQEYYTLAFADPHALSSQTENDVALPQGIKIAVL